jgi:hypothetical protein
MKLHRIGLVILVYLLSIAGCYADEHFPSDRWDHVPGQAAGWSVPKLAKAYRA